jgi:hypothetical protein
VSCRVADRPARHRRRLRQQSIADDSGPLAADRCDAALARARVPPTGSLARCAAVRATAAETPDQIKHVIALADAAIAYANRYYSEQREVIQRAKTAKLLAERRLGEMLRVMPKAKGTRTVGGDHRSGGSVSVPPENETTLADIGIDKKLSARSSSTTATGERLGSPQPRRVRVMRGPGTR